MPAVIPFIPLIAAAIGGGSAVAGGYLANKNRGTSSTSPTVDPKYQGLQGQILQQIQGRLAGGSLPPAFETGGIKNINSTYDAAAASRENALTARGLARSPVAAAGDTQATLARAGDIGTFRANLPLVARDLQTQDLGLAGNILNFGRGSTSTGTTESGGGAAGAATNLSQYLGYLQGKNAFGRRGQGLYPTGGTGGYYPPGDEYGVG